MTVEQLLAEIAERLDRLFPDKGRQVCRDDFSRAVGVLYDLHTENVGMRYKPYDAENGR